MINEIEIPVVVPPTTTLDLLQFGVCCEDGEFEKCCSFRKEDQVVLVVDLTEFAWSQPVNDNQSKVLEVKVEDETKNLPIHIQIPFSSTLRVELYTLK